MARCQGWGTQARLLSWDMALLCLAADYKRTSLVPEVCYLATPAVQDTTENQAGSKITGATFRIFLGFLTNLFSLLL